MKISNDKLKVLAQFGREMYRDDTTPDIERIAGMFPRGYISIVASMAGVGKTWLMQYTACQLSMGGKVLNGIVHKSPAYKTLIMTGETGGFLMDKRLGKTNWEYNPKNIKVYSAVEMSIKEIPILLNDANGRENITAIIWTEKPDLVYFDTLISFHSCDESKQGDMTAIYTYLLRLAQSFNCAVVCNHHMRKRPANTKSGDYRYTQDDVIGTSAGVRLSSAVYLLTAEDKEFGKSEVTVRNVKAWDKKIPSFKYSIVKDQTSGLLDMAISFDTEGNNIFWSMRERLAELVKSYPAGTIIKPEIAAREIQTSTENCRCYLEELVKHDTLNRIKIAGVYMYKVK